MRSARFLRQSYDRMSAVYNSRKQQFNETFLEVSIPADIPKGEIFGDHVIASAVLDRILHHRTTINIKGENRGIKGRRKRRILPHNC